MTRPTCLNCGSLGEYVRTSSLSVGMIAGIVSQLGVQYGQSIKDFLGRLAGYSLFRMDRMVRAKKKKRVIN